MSQGNVDIVRQFVLLELEEALTYADPDIIWNPVEEPPRRGHDAVRENLERWESGWEEYEAIPEQFVTTGDRVVATVHVRGRAAGAGSRSTRTSTRSTRCATARSCAWTSSPSESTPSKPLGSARHRSERHARKLCASLCAERGEGGAELSLEGLPLVL